MLLSSRVHSTDRHTTKINIYDDYNSFFLCNNVTISSLQRFKFESIKIGTVVFEITGLDLSRYIGWFFVSQLLMLEEHKEQAVPGDINRNVLGPSDSLGTSLLRHYSGPARQRPDRYL